MAELARLMTAMVTPYAPDGAVDYGYARALARHLVSIGNEGLVLAGTTGEAPLLSDEEKYRLWSEVREEVGPGVTIVAGAGTNDTHHSVELSRLAERAGADAILAVTPYYLRPPQEGIFRHFKAMAEATPLPVIVYNVPSRTGIEISLETMLRLAEVPGIVGDKEANGDLTYSAELLAAAPNFRIWSGNDSDSFHLWCMGAYGAISVTGHLVAGDHLRMMNLIAEGRVAEAAAIHKALLPVTKACFINGNPSSLRYAMRQLGYEIGEPRLPVVEPEGPVGEKIMALLSTCPMQLPANPLAPVAALPA
jgi:4-hydroxy-tetrahydrodipicolinate synthase